ncbi:hypothetical protein A3Q56_00811 [Intoshia linei]|uniref:Band 7 domain-containing protein n=1 Tax=Intoshia linei TaxID=1819745 RepID=A0A177BB37_9BILA|nr:hypothetical protein A3Q56_00811 [Intoshia linei]
MKSEVDLIVNLILGGLCLSGRKILVGKMGWAWWVVSDVSRLSLEIMTTRPSCNDVETLEGVRVSISSVCQIRVINNKELLDLALEQLLGKTKNEIIEMFEKTLDGHLRSILGTMKVEELYRDREEFSKRVREVAAPDVARMGIEILSFTIIDLIDHDEYLVSLGRTNVAMVKQIADIGVTEADKDSKIKIAQLEKYENEIICVSDTKKKEYKSAFDEISANLNVDIKKYEAEAKLAGTIESTKQYQLIKEEEMKAELLKNQKKTEIENIEIERVKLSLESTINKKTEIEAEVMNLIAENDKECYLFKTKGEIESVRLKGLANADALKIIGTAEAEAMQIKAVAFNQYGKMAIYDMILKKLPLIMYNITKPLTRTKDIIMLNDNKLSSQVTSLISGIQPSIDSLTGIDLSRVIKKLTGTSEENSKYEKISN